jgi:hypothetical protein
MIRRMCNAQRRFFSFVLLATLAMAAAPYDIAAQGPQGQAQPQGRGRGPQVTAAPRKLMLVDRTGAQTLLGEVPGNTNGPRVSPDGVRLAYGSGGLWVGPLMNLQAMKRIGDGQFPYWSADGTRLFFSPAAEILSWRRVDAEDVGEQLHTPVRAPESRSGDGKWLSFVVSADNKFSAWTMNLETRERTQILDSGPEAIGTNISPDGRWIAYQSTATGRYEIYVQPLGRPGQAVHVTTQESFRPLWSRDMRDMFFDTVVDGVRTLWVVPITTQPTFAVAGEPRALQIKGFVQGGVGRRMYDLLPDGRFVMMFP